MARTKLSAEQVAEGLGGLKGWKPDGERAISKRFVLKDHVAALGFVVKVAVTADVVDHHPEVHWAFNRVTFTLSTHDAGGLTARDFELAKRIDALR